MIKAPAGFSGSKVSLEVVTVELGYEGEVSESVIHEHNKGQKGLYEGAKGIYYGDRFRGSLV